MAGHNLLFRPNMLISEYDTAHDERNAEFGVSPDAEEYVKEHWEWDEDQGSSCSLVTERVTGDTTAFRVTMASQARTQPTAPIAVANASTSWPDRSRQRSTFATKNGPGATLRPTRKTLGFEDWVESIARRLNLESTMRPRGRKRVRFPKTGIKEA